MKILDESIKVSDDYRDIYDLKFLKDNPRVYACTHGVPNFDNLPEEQQQDIIYKKLLKESSVKNLLPEIRRHGGLMESILVRLDTKEVIEGNSRLAVYRKLHESPKEAGDWSLIPCNLVSSLTERQQAAYLNQIHVKGKTQWSAFEKANFAYVRYTKGKWGANKIADLFGESIQTIQTRIKVIQMMEENCDTELSHFSYYDVIVRNSEILKEVQKDSLLAKNLRKDIREFGLNEDKNKFTAQDLRNKLPHILKKPKVRKKYEKGIINLDDAFQLAKISRVEDKIKRATTLLDNVSRQDILQLEQNQFNAFRQAAKKLDRQTKRITDIIQSREQK